MAYTPIPDSVLAPGKPVKSSLLKQMRDNTDDHEQRLNALDVSVSTQILINEKLEKPRDIMPLGAIIWSSVDDTKFPAGTEDGEWVLVDGRNVSGSEWASLAGTNFIPDTRGSFMRMRDHGIGRDPQGARVLGHYQADEIASHTHDNDFTMSPDSHTPTMVSGFLQVFPEDHTHTVPITNSGDHDHDIIITRAASSGGGDAKTGFLWGSGWSMADLTVASSTETHSHAGIQTSSTDLVADGSFQTHTHEHTILGDVLASGGFETRPRNVALDAFIKINKEYIGTTARQYIIRLNQDLTINQVAIAPVEQGTAGSFQIDIKKGATPATATTSIFTALPTLAYNDTNPATGTVDANLSQCNAGDYLVVSVTQAQTKGKCVHVFIAGDI